MKRNYRIFVLFLLMSINIFALSYERVIIQEIDLKNYDEIKVNLVTITDNNMKKLELLNVRELREGTEISYDNIMISTKIKLENIRINGKSYRVTNNKIRIDGREQYVYGWVGTYKTKFAQEEGKQRKIFFKEKRHLISGGNPSKYNLSKTYIEPLKITPLPKEQYIYSQIIKANLVNSDKYIIDFYENVDTIKTIDEDGSLEEILKSDGGYSGADNFSQQEQERYNYFGNPKSVIEFNLKDTSETPKNGKFKLSIEENNVLKRKINENYIIPVPTTDFEEQDLERSKNTFTYEDEYELENLKAYKYQEVVFRLYTGSKHDGIRPIKKIQENVLNDDSYVDFIFENNGSVQEVEKDGIKGRFIEGKFELIGLEDGESYKLDFYTLRYRNNNKTGNYTAVTYESSLGFTGKNMSSLDSDIWLEDIDISEYKTIKLNMTSITTQEVKEVEVLRLIETRNSHNNAEKEEYTNIKTIKQSLENVWVEGKEYPVVDNKIILDDGTEKYAYKWSGIYITKFIQEEGKSRNLNIGTRRYLVKKQDTDEEYADVWLDGMYIEPMPVEVDTGYSHQWIMFEFNPDKEFKNQNYKIEDRVLTPKREGYRQLKTIDYGSSLDDYLYGKNEHTLKEEFSYSNGVWGYPKKNNSTGLIIEKTITESKGNLKGEDDSELVFYTDKKGNGIEKLGEIGNKVTYRWNEGPLNTNGEILNYDKVIFRITKKSSGADYSWNPYINDNPINYVDETTEGNHRLEEFLFGNENYVDLVLDASTSKTITLNNAIISYEQTNKELRIVGLPVGGYTIEFYSVKRGHDGGYKVITYENQDEFKMDISDIAGPDFEKENNIHKIDFITTGEEKGNIQVNVNFITKMERSINLTVDNLKSGTFNLEEINEGTGEKEGIGEDGKISLKESDMKKFLFPLDVIFVIDNSGSMQNEIDNVKNGLSAFGQKLLDRGFDVKYNLITFGPQQTSGTIGNWANNIAEYKDRYGYYYYMATYKSGWFDGSKLGKTSSPENDLEELTDAFSRIRAGGGYPYGQENSAWGIHNAIEKLRENGRYLSYSGEIVEDSAKGYMPSEKMIIFLTDENMDGENLPSGYDEDDVLEKLYSKLNGTYNGMPDNIDLNGIFHVKKDGNTAEGANEYLTRYDDVPGLGYKYTSGYKEKKEWLYYSKKEWINQGWIRKEQWDRYYANNPDYRMEDESIYYSYGYWRRMGHMWKYEWERGGYANNPDYRIDRSNTNKVWYSKREWQQQRQPISREYWNTYYVNNENYRIDEEHVLYSYAQWTSQRAITREEWEQNYEGDSDYRLDRVVDLGGEWIEYDDNETPILGIDPADDGDISHTDFKYYNTANNFFMYEMGSRGEHVSKALDLAINNLGIIQRWELSYLTPFNEYDGTTRTIDFELVNLIGKDGTPVNRKITNLNQEEDKQYTVKEEKLALEFEDPSVDNLELSIIDGRGTITFLGKARYTDYDDSNQPIIVEDMIKEYKLDVLDSSNKLLFSRNTDNIEMSLSNKENLEDTFGEQGWYQFKVILTEDEIQILINSETVKSTEKINLEATIVTDLFNKTRILQNVEVDLSTPEVTNISLENKTLFNFLNTMYSLDKNKTFPTDQAGNYSGYDVEIGMNYVIPNDGNYGKSGDKIDLELIVEGKNIDEYDVAKGIGIDGWSNPKIEPYSNNASHKLKKFKVSWKNEVISISGASNAVVKNDIKNQFGFTASQDITVLKFDNEIEVFPKVTGIQIIDNIYYVNSDYNIDLGTADTGLRSGIAILDYDKTQADTTKDGDYYGKYEKYYEIEKPIFGGGTRSGSIPVVIDSGDNHSTDGEYSTQVYGMSRSGKLDGVTNYFDGDFKTVMKNSSSGENIIVRVDTVAPGVTNISVEESNETSDENYYNFDVSFDIEDFNASYKKLDENIKGGYLLKLKNDNTEILDEPVYDGNKTVAYKIKVKKPKVSNGLITEVTIIAEDKAGNRKEEKVKIRVPKDIKLKVYEEIQGWGNGKKTKIKDSEREYIFTKGGAISLINDPVIYAVVPKSTGPDDDTKITKLKIEKLNESENPVAEKILDLSGGSENVEIKFNFSREGKNRVRVTPISKVGIEGKPKELNFILDTRINTSYLDNEIIGSLKGGDVEIDLSKIEELSGVEGYEYIFSVEGKVSEKVIKRGLKGKSFVTPKEGSISGTEIIDTSTFIGGSNGILLFTVYDNLGHRKTFEKTYFIPKESDGIIAKISGEAKQRESKLRIVTSGIELESTIDRSSEYESDDENEDSEDSLNKI
ncbi:vWA domain-containing protein [Psychrilyobacter atlanticus]|uniref:vWA domain-containing protein n=1 Tax=Psychrilyobacter atlanticus TaxID=271091 RepID=UPI0012EB6D06|nr:vWA domain-containing protein [Psychrilyobacter atlanticus]